MKINSNLRIKAGFRAGMHGRINRKIEKRDRFYRLGIERGEEFYRREFRDKTRDDVAEAMIASSVEPPLVFRGLMTKVPNNVTIFRAKKKAANLSRIERSTRYESLPDLSFGAAI